MRHLCIRGTGRLLDTDPENDFIALSHIFQNNSHLFLHWRIFMKKIQIFTMLMVLALLYTLPNRAFSQQITLTANDFLGQIGTRQVVIEDKRFSIPIDVGSPGANQVWDFTNQIIGDSVFAITEFLRLDQTVSATTFPDANMVQKITLDEAPGSSFFNFFNITPTQFLAVGDSAYVSISGFDTSFVFFKNDTLAPLPVEFNDTWLTAERDTTGFFPLNANISIDTTLNTVDGWGTVKLPIGDFQCLRLKQEVKVINQTIINGALFSTSVDSFLQYDWIAKDVFMVASAQSQNGDMNPNFTNAQGFGRLDSLSFVTSVENSRDLTQIPTDFELSQNFPNPFNPETVIRYELKKNTEIELTIYNLLGQKIRVLVSKNQPAGSYQMTWNGTDELGRPVSSGVYLYELRAGDVRQSRKMLLLQ